MSDTDTARAAQGKVVISLPKEVGLDIDTLGDTLAEAIEQQTGVRFELSRAQVVQSIVKQAIDRMDAAYDAVNTEGEQ